jgi:hypothetical protein
MAPSSLAKGVIMTPEEHMLMLSLYFKQQQAIRILLDMLKSRGVLTADDEAAFAFAQTQNTGSNASIFDEAKNSYLTMAHAVGVGTGLEHMPEPPLEWFHPPKP